MKKTCYIERELKELGKKDFDYKLISSKNNKIIKFRTLLKITSQILALLFRIK